MSDTTLDIERLEKDIAADQRIFRKDTDELLALERQIQSKQREVQDLEQKHKKLESDMDIFTKRVSANQKKLDDMLQVMKRHEALVAKEGQKVRRPSGGSGLW